MRNLVGSSVGAALRAELGRARGPQPWAELAWVLLGVPLTLLCLLPPLVLLTFGLGLAPVFLGLLVLAGALLTARLAGAPHRWLAANLLGVPVTTPPPARLRPGLWNWITGRLGDRTGWRHLGYLLLRLPLSVLGLAVTGIVLLYGVAALSYPVFWFTLDGAAMPVFDLRAGPWPLALLLGLTGLLALLATPALLHGVTAADRLLAAALLGPSRLDQRVQDLERSRASAVRDAGTRLRRIERDLHDGAQAQLVAMAMKLGVAKEELAEERPDLARLRTLVSAAHGDAKQALGELRDLAHGIHPAALDSGLAVALSTVLSRSAGNARLRVELPRRPPAEVETILYFSATELLANAAKHGEPEGMRIELTEVAGTVRLLVSDQGPGGALVRPGGGLAGLAERVSTVDGGLEVSSPPGGPTVIGVWIPMDERR